MSESVKLLATSMAYHSKSVYLKKKNKLIIFFAVTGLETTIRHMACLGRASCEMGQIHFEIDVLR